MRTFTSGINSANLGMKILRNPSAAILFSRQARAADLPQLRGRMRRGGRRSEITPLDFAAGSRHQPVADLLAGERASAILKERGAVVDVERLCGVEQSAHLIVGQ